MQCGCSFGIGISGGELRWDMLSHSIVGVGGYVYSSDVDSVCLVVIP